MDDPGVGVPSGTPVSSAMTPGTPNAKRMENDVLLDDDSKILWKSDTGSVLTSVSETDEEGAAAKREHLFVKAQELEAKVRRLIKQIDKEMEKELQKLKKTKEQTYAKIQKNLAAVKGMPVLDRAANCDNKGKETMTMSEANVGQLHDLVCRCRLAALNAGVSHFGPALDKEFATPVTVHVSPALEKQADAQDDGDEEGASRDGSVESLGSRVGKSGNSPFEPPASVSPLKWEETTSPAPPISLNDETPNGGETEIASPATPAVEPPAAFTSRRAYDAICANSWSTPRDLIHNTPDEYHLQLDLAGYPQGDLALEINDHNILTIEASMEEAVPDGTKLVKLMQRAYLLPDDVDQHGLRHRLDPDGMLVITIDKLASPASKAFKAFDSADVEDKENAGMKQKSSKQNLGSHFPCRVPSNIEPIASSVSTAMTLAKAKLDAAQGSLNVASSQRMFLSPTPKASGLGGTLTPISERTDRAGTCSVTIQSVSLNGDEPLKNMEDKAFDNRFKLGSSLASSPGTNHLVALSKALVGQDVDKAREGESVVDGVFSVDAHSPEANQLSLNDKSSDVKVPDKRRTTIMSPKSGFHRIHRDDVGELPSNLCSPAPTSLLTTCEQLTYDTEGHEHGHYTDVSEASEGTHRMKHTPAATDVSNAEADPHSETLNTASAQSNNRKTRSQSSQSEHANKDSTLERTNRFDVHTHQDSLRHDDVVAVENHNVQQQGTDRDFLHVSDTDNVQCTSESELMLSRLNSIKRDGRLSDAFYSKQPSQRQAFAEQTHASHAPANVREAKEEALRPRTPLHPPPDTEEPCTSTEYTSLDLNVDKRGAAALERLIQQKMKPPTPVRRALFSPLAGGRNRTSANSPRMSRKMSGSTQQLTPVFGNVSSWFSHPVHGSGSSHARAASRRLRNKRVHLLNGGEASDAYLGGQEATDDQSSPLHRPVAGSDSRTSRMRMALPVRDVSRQRRDTTERRRSRSGLRIDAGRGRRSPSFVGRRKTSVSRSNTSFWNGCSERERTGASPARIHPAMVPGFMVPFRNASPSPGRLSPAVRSKQGLARLRKSSSEMGRSSLMRVGGGGKRLSKTSSSFYRFASLM
jgi:HSP20 family molecular chaperone IbpA